MCPRGIREPAIVYKRSAWHERASDHARAARAGAGAARAGAGARSAPERRRRRRARARAPAARGRRARVRAAALRRLRRGLLPRAGDEGVHGVPGGLEHLRLLEREQRAGLPVRARLRERE